MSIRQTRDTTSYRLDADECEVLDRDGFVVREGVFDARECRAIADDCEALAARVVALSHGQKHLVGSYMFERQAELAMYVKWEPDAPDVVQGVEPFAHISEPLHDWGLDPRLFDPSKDLVGTDHVALFTEKLTCKRARTGGHIVPNWPQSGGHISRKKSAKRGMP